MMQRPFYYTTLGADPTNADVVYAGAEGFYKSTDGGKTFTTLRTPHGDNHDIWVSPNDGNVMIQSNDGGANVSTDGGRTWSTQMNQPTVEFYGVWLDNQFPYKLYGAQQDNTTVDHRRARPSPYDADRLAHRPRMRDRSDHPAPDEPEHRLRLVQGPVQRDEPEDRAGARTTGSADSRSTATRRATSSCRFQRVSPMALSPHDPRCSTTARSTSTARATRA